MTWVNGVWKGSRNPDIDILLPGLDRGEGRSKDRLKLSGATNEQKLYEARKGMLKDLHTRLLFEPLRALYDKTVTLREVEAACRQGEAGMVALVKQVGTKQLATLVAPYARVCTSAEPHFVETKLRRFVGFIGGDRDATTDDLTAKNINRFLEQLEAESRTKKGESRLASNGTRNRYRADIQGFCSWCLREGHISTSPFAVVGAVKVYSEHRRRLPDLEPDEQVKYLDKVEELENADYRMLMWAAIETGADVAELVGKRKTAEGALTVRHCKLIDVGVSRIRFIRTKTADRGTVEREVPITPEFANALALHIQRHRLGKDDAVFGMCEYWWAGKVHRRAIKRVTKQHITRKDLRHIAAINWRLHGADLEQVREWLGLVNLSQVQVYAGIKPRDNFDAPVVQGIQKARKINTLRAIA